jgi:SAM-dependent methyltransferase
VLDEILIPVTSMDRAPPEQVPERMDRPDCDPDRLRDALATLARANRRFGARDATLDAALRLLDGRRPGPVRVLDVGTGSGDIGEALARRLRARGWRPRPTLADLHPTTLRIARDRVPDRPGWAATFVRLTAGSLPFRDDSFDLAVSATMLHHLEREEARAFLRELDRVAVSGWVVTDLRRSRAAWLAVRLLAATLWRRHPLPREDGPASVRRAFTAGEARDLAMEAGLGDASVERLRPFRLRITRGAA